MTFNDGTRRVRDIHRRQNGNEALFRRLLILVSFSSDEASLRETSQELAASHTQDIMARYVRSLLVPATKHKKVRSTHPRSN